MTGEHNIERSNLRNRTKSEPKTKACKEITPSEHNSKAQNVESANVRAKYIKDIVYGGLDGIVTTFAIVSGVAGASLSSSIILILGIANLIADGFSMAVGSYLGTKSEMEFSRKQQIVEELELVHNRDHEIKLLRDIYRKKGFSGEDLERAVEIITSNKEVWLQEMMIHKLELLPGDDSAAWKSAVATFCAFVLVGMAPLLTYVISIFYPQLLKYAFGLTTFVTGFTIFWFGALKSLYTGINWFRSGLEMLVIGGMAAGVAYWVGYLLREFQFEYNS